MSETEGSGECPAIPMDKLDPIMRIVNGFSHELDQEMIADGISASHRARLIGAATRRFIGTVNKAYSQAVVSHPEAFKPQGAANA